MVPALMIFARFDTEALTKVRFAISPMLEAIRSVTALEDPASVALHLPWAEQARRLDGGPRPEPLRALQRSGDLQPGLRQPAAQQPAGGVRGRAAT